MTITTTNDARALSAISRLLENKKRLSNQDISFILREVVEWLVAVVTGIRFFQLQEQTQEMTRLSAETGAECSSSAAQPASTDQAQLTPPTFFAQK